MLGAIAGDIVGSVYEFNPIKSTDFPLFKEGCRFTDDSVLSVAVADAILHRRDYVDLFKEYYNLYPNAGYGKMFAEWARSDSMEPYNSWGNGSAMRVCPIGFACSNLETVLQEARKSAEVTHSHPDGVKGAMAVAACVFLARQEAGKEDIKRYVETTFQYSLGETLDAIRKSYQFDVSCQGSVPQAITAFLESRDFEDALRMAVSLGGDSDTQACIAGGIAQAYYKGIPEPIYDKVYAILDDHLKQIVFKFSLKFRCF